ncbi:hypothetical protein CRUP_038452, partial [Coryphaenoides rupestris]
MFQGQQNQPVRCSRDSRTSQREVPGTAEPASQMFQEQRNQPARGSRDSRTSQRARLSRDSRASQSEAPGTAEPASLRFQGQQNQPARQSSAPYTGRSPINCYRDPTYCERLYVIEEEEEEEEVVALAAQRLGTVAVVGFGHRQQQQQHANSLVLRASAEPAHPRARCVVEHLPAAAAELQGRYAAVLKCSVKLGWGRRSGLNISTFTTGGEAGRDQPTRSLVHWPRYMTHTHTITSRRPTNASTFHTTKGKKSGRFSTRNSQPASPVREFLRSGFTVVLLVVLVLVPPAGELLPSPGAGGPSPPAAPPSGPWWRRLPRVPAAVTRGRTPLIPLLAAAAAAAAPPPGAPALGGGGGGDGGDGGGGGEGAADPAHLLEACDMVRVLEAEEQLSDAAAFGHLDEPRLRSESSSVRPTSRASSAGPLTRASRSEVARCPPGPRTGAAHLTGPSG